MSKRNFARRAAKAPRPARLRSAALRHVANLHRLRLAVEEGGSVGEALERARPPVHFRRQAIIETALRTWTSERLPRVMAQLSDAVFETRKQPALAEAIAHRALTAIAVNARQRAS